MGLSVNQLHGELKQIKQELRNKFIGKNFVFDDRLAERILIKQLVLATNAVSHVMITYKLQIT